ncbi:MAG: alpha-xylosidase [Treponema sp.]|jgi:alpha-D-xyloside xylohydrolase|nr:alpha-xylosidase [Treponema sp.]
MKFRDGYWEMRKGVAPLNLVGNVEGRVADGALSLWTTNRRLSRPGERVVGIPLITTVFSSPAPDVIRVRMYHHRGAVSRGPFFRLPGDRTDTVIEEGPEAWTLRTGKGALSVTVEKDAWGVTFRRGDRVMTSISGRNSGHFTVEGEGSYMAQYLNLGVGELIYGLGERFTPWVKNGQAVECWNEDGGTASEQAYKNVPFYLSGRAYGVLVNNPGKVSFEIGSEVVSAAQFSVAGEKIDYYLIAGDDLKDVIRHYTALTGRPALPPAWSFGLWLSTSFTTDYDEKTVTHFVSGMEERKIPLHVFHFDCFWMKGCQWVDFEWDKEQFPDPAGILRRLHDRGLKICVWINPYVAQKSPLFDEAMARGFLLKRPNGDVWQWDRWQPGMGLVDFTNPAAAAWYAEKLRGLLRMGVDCFKTDFGERIPLDAAYYDGSEPQGMHNYYTYLYNKTVFDLLEEERGAGEAVVFARSATVGSQRFPLHWGGDCAATYESMAETLRGGLSLGLGGFGFWSHDISGFESTATADLFKRWCAFGLLSSHSRLHGNQSYRVPWNFDDEASEVLRFFTELKCTLMPYLWAKAVESHTGGLPLLRAMILEFPRDPGCAYLDRQYMLGDALLVAPIFDGGGKVDYYLPAGRWTPILSGESIESGGLWRKERHGYKSLPLLARPHSVIPLGNNKERPDYDYADGITFHVFELADGGEVTVPVYTLKGDLESRFTVSRRGGEYNAENSGSTKPWKLLLRGLRAGADTVVSGGLEVTNSPEGLLVSAAGPVKICGLGGGV